MMFIGARFVDQIVQAAEKAYPDECCGLLAGTEETDGEIVVTRVALSANVSEESLRDRFEVDPKVRFDLMRELEDGPERIVGHYHSHPDHPAQPSEHDLKMAFEPDLMWLIVGVDRGSVKEIRAHRIDKRSAKFCEIPVKMT